MRRMYAISLGWMLAAALAMAGRAHAGAYTLHVVASTGGQFASLGDGPSINDAGAIAFQATLSSGGAVIIVRQPDGSRATIAQTSPGGFTSLSERPSIDRESGFVAFTAADTEGVGVYRGEAGGGITTIAEPTFALINGFPVMQPGGGGIVIFAAAPLGGTPAIYRGSGGAPMPLITARDGFTDLGNNPGVNHDGTLAFRALGPDGPRIYIRTPDGLITSVSPSGLPLLSYAGTVALNSAGIVAFRARLPNAVDAMVMGPPSNVQMIAATDGPLLMINVPALNDAGAMVFRASIDIAAGGGAGVFRGPDIVNDAVARTGQALDGSSIIDVAMHSSAINSAGQVVFMAALADGRSAIVRADPLSALCPADIVVNGAVDVDDLIAVILQWGPCATCAADIAPLGGNGTVDVDDLIAVILTWGPCP